MEFNQSIQECFSEFIQEYGEKQFRKIKGKLLSSNSYQKNLHLIIGNYQPIRAGTIIGIVSSISFFTFTSKRNTAIAALIALQQRTQFSNPNYDILTKDQVNELVEEIMRKSSGMLW